MPALRLLLLLPLLLLQRSTERAQPVPEAAKPTLETDLKTLADAANEAAKREAAQWFYFVTIMITLAAIIGSTTHRVLFLEEPVKVPLLSIDLPLVGFYWTAPMIFLLLHFYLLAQVREMRGKIAAFLDAAEQQADGNKTALRLALKRLDPFPVATLLAAKRLGDPALPIRLMVWTTLAVAPLCLLLFVQIRFLPYHDPIVTWWHRMVLGADLGMLWWLWPRAAPLWYRWNGLSGVLGMVLSAAIIFFAGLLATVPGERVDRVAPRLPGPLQTFQPRQDAGPLEIFLTRIADRAGFRRGDNQAPADGDSLPEESLAAALRRALFDGEVDRVTQRPRSVFSRNFVLPDQTFLTAEDRKAFLDDAAKAVVNIPRTLVLRGRDLRRAMLDRTDLRRADLIGANLQEVRLSGARLDGAQLQGASLEGARLQGASLEGAGLQGARLNFAQLQGARLVGAELQGARLVGAQLQGARLDGAQLQGARLAGAQLQEAWLDGAQLQGARLDRAELQGARLVGAQLQGARLDGAQLQGASLIQAELQGASFDRAQLQGAWLDRAELQGTSFDRAQLQGASLIQAQLQGAWLDGAQLQGARLRGAAVWRASAGSLNRPDDFSRRADLDAVDLQHLSFTPSSPQNQKDPIWTTWGDWTDAWLASIPESDARTGAERQLARLTDDLDATREAALRATWPDPVPDNPPDPRRVADRLTTLSCAAEHAPYVARGIIQQLESRDLGAAAAPLLARLVDAENCPGTRGFTDGDRARLAQLVARIPSPAAAPNASGATP